MLAASGAVSCATVILWGTESDVLTEREVEAAVSGFTNVRVIPITGAGHLALGDNPIESVDAIERFILGQWSA